MNTRHVLLSGLTGLALAAAACGGDAFEPPAPVADAGVAGDGTLPTILEEIRAGWDVPALGAMLIHQGQLLEIAAVGRRALGSAETVTTEDLWHVGSLTKSMTASAAGALVEAGQISWTTTVTEALPDIADDIQADYRDVTLEELLSHTGGLTNQELETTWWQTQPHSEPLHEQRVDWSVELLNVSPPVARGTFLYANANYIVAGAMLEEVSGLVWEDLMQAYVFQRLNMSSVGFGAPGSSAVDQPWGHAPNGTDFRPVEPGPEAENPPAIGPAGTVHLSMPDFAKYAADHIAGERGENGFLRAETFQKLHARVSSETVSALGWVTPFRVWADGIALQHTGSNGIWYAVVWLAPERDFGMFAVTNAGGELAGVATDAATAALLERFEAFVAE